MKKQKSTITIMLHLHQHTIPDSDLFIAMNIDDTAGIKFNRFGVGEVLAQVESGEFMCFGFTLEALPFVIRKYSRPGVRWTVRQHRLPQGMVSNHPLQRFFTFSFDGLATDVIAFAPGIDGFEDAIKIMQAVPTIQTVATPAGMVDNLALMRYLEASCRG